MKKVWILSALSLTILLMSGCSTSKTPVKESTPKVTTQDTKNVAAKGTLTLEQLKKYDGQNGNPGYVAIDGTIYDVSNVKEWKGGKHKNGLTAGNDLSDAIGGSPHGKAVLTKLPVIGKLK